MLPANFEIAFPWVFLLLPMPLLLYWLMPPLRIRSASIMLPTYQRVLKHTGQQARAAALVRRRGILSWLMLGVAWILTLGALSSPQIIGEPEMKVKTSRNFLIVADISFSMAQKDWTIEDQPARRWDAVKDLMGDFIERRKGDRMGLIFFGSSAYIQAPFTPDLSTVSQLLDEADVGMAGQMTHIGKAITKGVEMFRKDTIETKAMLLLTDGVDAGTEILPLDAADIAQEDSIIIYTVGIGDPGNKGSDLDERTLEEIADMTGGQYFRAIDEDRLEEIYTEVEKLEPIEYEEEENRPVTFLYFYPLAGALAVMLLLSIAKSVGTLLRKSVHAKEAYA